MNIIEMRAISKAFAFTQALDNVDFYLRKGEILSLLGENGAGKSTLMKILYGMIQPDSGEIFYQQKPTAIHRPLDAIEMGICMVHQHFMLVPAFTVTENIIAGSEPAKGLAMDLPAARRSVQEIIDRFHFDLDPDARVEHLSVGEQQRVEILKALYRNVNVLILDEPTAVLTPHEVDALFDTLRVLRENGTSIVIITHKLRETIALADRVSVLRDGRLIHISVDPKTTTVAELSEMMVGRQVRMHVRNDSKKIGEAALQVRNLNVTQNGRTVLDQIAFDVHDGEILGVAGIEGNGQSQLLECLTGLRKPESMELLLHGQPISGNANTFLRRGVGHIPEDRQAMGLVVDMGLAENLILGYHRTPRVCHNGFLNRSHMQAYALRCKEEFGIKISTIESAVKSMSGGNQQKVVIARALSNHPDVLVVAHPTRGVDIGAMEYIHQQLFALRDSGKAVFLVSADLDEVRSLSDRILVLYEGRIVATCAPDQYTEVELGMLMTGSTPEQLREVQ